MQFNSYIFICLFLPAIISLYFIGNKINNLLGKNILLIGSVIYYAYSNQSTLIIMGISLAINYLFAYAIKKKQKWSKLFLFVPVTINICLLLYFKYTNFAITNINAWFEKEIPLKELILPVGISFFTFQQIAYVVAIFKNEIVGLNPIDYLVYILYFPKILMGPLADPVDFISQLNNNDLKKIDWNNVSYGLKIFSYGLFKKLLLADTFAKAVTWGYANVDAATAMDWLLIMLFYTFEIYFDFSGYSDMAVGASIMLNITLPINFDSPYKAVSIRDFWKRWHISLTKFFTKYIYIPLGGSRKGTFFTYLNTMIVFVVSGIWHGANWTFVLWGVLHGIFSLIDRIIEKLNIKIFEPFRWLMTFSIVNVLWLLFRSDSVKQWKHVLGLIKGMGSTAVSDGLIKVFTIQEASFLCDYSSKINEWSNYIRGFWMLGFIGLAGAVCFLPENNYKTLKKNNFLTMVFAAIAFVWSFICLGSESVFVYFNF